MRALFSTVLVVLLLGCGVLLWTRASHAYDDRTYLVLDIDSLEPIPNAEVTKEPVNFLLPKIFDLFLPAGDSGRTDRDGVVTIRVARNHTGFLESAGATGFTMAFSQPEGFKKPSGIDEIVFLERCR